MIKTPQEMALEFSKFDSTSDLAGDLSSYRQGLFEGYIAGYQAAQQTNIVLKSAMERPPEKQLYIPDPDIFTNKSDDIDLEQQMAALSAYMDECQKRILQLEDTNSSKKLDGWISVKERLPEESVGWTTVYGCVLSRWAVQPGFYDRNSKKWISRFIGGYEDEVSYVPFNSVSHWMPLPNPPKVK